VKKSSSSAKGSGAKVPRQARAKAQRKPGPADPTAQTGTSDRILISAARLFATLGFANTSMPAIAKQSGITPGAIYRHFESKAQLLMEVVHYALQTLPTSVQVLEPAELDANDLPQFVASYTTPQYKLIRQLSLEIHAAASRAHDARAILSKVDEQSAQVISRSISAAQQSAAFEKNLDPYFAAILVQVMIIGLSHLDTLQPDLIGNRSWHDFVLGRISAVLGCRRPTSTNTDSNHDPLSSSNAEY
jgi:AcrR family transcriptional regulator